MSSPSQFRASALRFATLARASCNPEARKNLQDRERSANALADNAQWLIDHVDHTVRRSEAEVSGSDKAAIDRWDTEGGSENPVVRIAVRKEGGSEDGSQFLQSKP